MFKKIASAVKNAVGKAGPRSASSRKGFRGVAAKLAEGDKEKLAGTAGLADLAATKMKKGGLADKEGRAMKKTSPDAVGRAMPKKMVGGGMAKGYKSGGMAKKKGC
jgi:hypothetical protein